MKLRKNIHGMKRKKNIKNLGWFLQRKCRLGCAYPVKEMLSASSSVDCGPFDPFRTCHKITDF